MAMGIPPRYKTDDDGCNGAGRLEQCSRQYAENQSDERVRRKCEQGFDALRIAEFHAKALADQANGHEQHVYRRDNDEPTNGL